MIKREIKIFLTSFLLTNVWLVYYNSHFFHSSIIEGIITTFTYANVIHLLIALGVYFLGYLIFRLLYFVFSYLFRKFSFKTPVLIATLTFVLVFFILFVFNDYLIYQDVNTYPFEQGSFNPKISEEIKIDSSNFHLYTWVSKTIVFYDSEFIVEEKLIFPNNFSFELIGSRTKIDRLYLFRKVFYLSDSYEVKGKLNHSYSVQIKNNKLYFNKN